MIEEEANTTRKYWCPDKKCKQHKVYMSIEDNWEHLMKHHKAGKRTPIYKKLPHGWK